jgi:hypothetical protein
MDPAGLEWVTASKWLRTRGRNPRVLAFARAMIRLATDCGAAIERVGTGH